MNGELLSFGLFLALGTAWCYFVSRAPKWMEARRHRAIERFYYGPHGEVEREATKLSDPGVHRPYWR